MAAGLAISDDNAHGYPLASTSVTGSYGDGQSTKPPMTVGADISVMTAGKVTDGSGYQ